MDADGQIKIHSNFIGHSSTKALQPGKPGETGKFQCRKSYFPEDITLKPFP